jgi:hypothetical protein
MTSAEMQARIQAAAPEGKIACAAAFRLAEELKITRQELGNLLNNLHIKIVQCQLGCF